MGRFSLPPSYSSVSLLEPNSLTGAADERAGFLQTSAHFGSLLQIPFRKFIAGGPQNERDVVSTGLAL